MLRYGILLALVLLFAFLVLLAVIGVYVYRDARDRRMHAPVWTLVAVAAPFLTGFIVYLIVRGAHPNLRCPSCGEPVGAQFLVCPEVRRQTAACLSFLLVSRGGELECLPALCRPASPGRYELHTRSSKKRQGTWKNPGGRHSCAACPFPAQRCCCSRPRPLAAGKAGGVGATTMETGDYLQTMANPEIESWLQESQSGAADAYALRYETGEGDERRVEYLVYVPAWASDASLSVGQTSDIFGRYVEIDCKNKGGSESFLIVSGDGDPLPQLRLSFGRPPCLLRGAGGRFSAGTRMLEKTEKGRRRMILAALLASLFIPGRPSQLQ